MHQALKAVRLRGLPAGDLGEGMDLPDGLLGAIRHVSLHAGIPLACQRVRQLLPILLKGPHYLHCKMLSHQSLKRQDHHGLSLRLNA